MYNYILNQWRMGAVTAEWVQGKVPRFITQAQCDVILATPQDLIGTASVTNPTI